MPYDGGIFAPFMLCVVLISFKILNVIGDSALTLLLPYFL